VWRRYQLKVARVACSRVTSSDCSNPPTPIESSNTAKIYIQNAAAEARTTEEFCERLAAQVSAPADRTAFLKAVRIHLAKGSQN
jgi:hypothetical protein